MKLNQQWIDMNVESIRQVLGEPYVVAEDGEVYLRGNQAIKVYIKPGTGQIDGVDLFEDHLQ